MAFGFYHDSTVCTECKACQVACQDLHNMPVGYKLRKVTCVEGGKFPMPWVYFVSMACNHCENPACTGVCPTGAAQKREDGSVWIEAELCIGCQSCVNACPYGAPVYMDELGITYKCDACFGLREKGCNPVCVDACLMRALEYGDIDELRAKHEGENLKCDIPPMGDASVTAPNFIVNAKDVDLSSYSIAGVI